MVRAMAEEHVFTIDDFLVYSAAKDAADPVLIRERVRNGDSPAVTAEAARLDGRGLGPASVNGIEPEKPRESLSLEVNAASGDVGFFRWAFSSEQAAGHLVSRAAAYLVIHGIERAGGINPDNWWALTCNECSRPFSASALFRRLAAWSFSAAR